MESNGVGSMSHRHSREGGGHLNGGLNGVRGSRAGSWREGIGVEVTKALKWEGGCLMCPKTEQ